ncbi:MAG TPA: hypothetical protein VNA27_17515 [Rubrobacteraceae bacterium]|nr:hypothetical protein [Rubrobacteraceae bacterium]
MGPETEIRVDIDCGEITEHGETFETEYLWPLRQEMLSTSGLVS